MLHRTSALAIVLVTAVVVIGVVASAVPGNSQSDARKQADEVSKKGAYVEGHGVETARASEGDIVTIAAGQGVGSLVNESEPVNVKAAAGNLPRGGQKITGRTSTNGNFTVILNNASCRPVTDVHAHIVNVGGVSHRIAGIGVTGGDGKWEGQVADPVYDPQKDPQDQNLRREGSVKTVGANEMDSNQTLTLDLKLASAPDGEWVWTDNEDIEIYVWWTQGALRENEVKAYERDEMGNYPHDAIANAVLDLDADPTLVGPTSGTFACPDMTMGECEDRRFQNGDVLVAPPTGFSFELGDELAVFAVYADGASVPAGKFNASNFRIDDVGNFVFTINRAGDDTEHAAFVIRGLKISSAHPIKPATVWHASISGSAFSGGSWENLYKLLVVTD